MEYVMFVLLIANLSVSITILVKFRRLNTPISTITEKTNKPVKPHFLPLKKRDNLPLEERQRRTVLQNIERYNGTREGQKEIPKE